MFWTIQTKIELSNTSPSQYVDPYQDASGHHWKSARIRLQVSRPSASQLPLYKEPGVRSVCGFSLWNHWLPATSWFAWMPVWEAHLQASGGSGALFRDVSFRRTVSLSFAGSGGGDLPPRGPTCTATRSTRQPGVSRLTCRYKGLPASMHQASGSISRVRWKPPS